MSTKTSFKRIALVAVAALGFGMLSVVPSNAETQADTLAASATTSSTTINTAAKIYVTQTFIGGANTDYLKATAYVISAPAYSVALPTWTTLTSDSATALGYTQVSATMDSTVAQVMKVTNSTNGAAYVQATNQLSFNAAIPGTYTIKVVQTNATSSGAAAAQGGNFTWTVTVGSTNPANSSYTKAYMVAGAGSSCPAVSCYAAAYDLFASQGATDSAAADAAITAAAGGAVTNNGNTRTVVAGTLGVAGGPTTAGAFVANIAVILRNNTPALNTALSTPLTVSVDGPGYVGIGSHAVLGKSVTESVTTAGADGYSNKDKNVWVVSDGSTGKATVTITAGGATLATKTIIFYGTPAKITSSGYYDVLDNTGSATAGDELSVYVADAAGNAVLNAEASIKLTSSDLTVLQSTAAGSSGCVADAISGAGYYTCEVKAVAGVLSGKSATITPSIVLSLTSTIKGDAVTYSIGGTTIASLTLTTDATSYDVGAKGSLILTAKDSSGNPVADTKKFRVFNSTVAAGGTTGSYAGLATTAAITTTPFAAAAATATASSGGIYFAKGVAKATFYAPSTTAATITFSGTAGASATADVSAALNNFGYGTALSVTVSINPSAAVETAQAAVDAAAEATDAANAATDAANAAAEAADAATAAAQDAADAVAALSAQVATLISGLKSQLTALTNLVIKIQKKVKA